jgi:two-component system sensor histidine kinase DesK
VRAASANGVCTLEIEDDGRGGAQPEGSGLRGMRERLEALGGRVDWRRDRSGTTLTVTVPVGDPSPVLAALGSESGG